VTPGTLTGVFVPVLIGYLLCLVSLAYLSYRKTDTVKEFFVMGGSAGAFLTGWAYFATQFSMSSLMGVPGTLYGVGFAGQGIILSVAMFSMAFGVLLAGRRLQHLSRRLNLLTLPDYLASRYQSDVLRLLGALIIIVFLIPYMAAQIVGSGVIFNVFTGAPYWFGALIMGGVVIAYCMVGGMRAAILSDALQGLVMVTAATATFFAVAAKGGGVTPVMQELARTDPGAMSFPGHPVAYLTWRGYVSQILMWTVFSVGQPQLVNKYLSARDYPSLLRGSIISGVAITLTCMTIWTAGVMARVVVPGIERTDWVVPTILVSTMTPLAASILQTGILAAGMSTISSIIVVVGGAFSRDIYQKLVRRDASDRAVLRLSRVMTLGVGALAVSLAMARPATIFQIVLFSWSGTGIMAVPILVGLYWKRASAPGAILGVVSGLSMLLLLTFWLPSWACGFHPLIVASAVALFVLAGVSLLSGRRTGEILQAHFRSFVYRFKPATAACLAALGLLYFVVWLPVPWMFPWKRYVPGFFGIPAFIWVWVAVQVLAGAVLHAYRRKLSKEEVP